VETKELVALLDDINGQLALEEKAKTGDPEAMIGFVRFCVLRKVYINKLIPAKDKIKSFESLMDLVVLTVAKEEKNG